MADLSIKGYDEGQLATVKGLQGQRHFIFNEWKDSKLLTLCGRSISPNYYDLSSYPDCLRCRKVLRKLRRQAKRESNG